MWQHRGLHRPDFAIEPQSGQESVWDYPRPPRISKDARRVVVRSNGKIIAESSQCFRVMETASPPTFYIPPEHINFECLVENTKSSFCEWKGQASYYDLQPGPELVEDVGWSYHRPVPEFILIKDYLCFYPSKIDCFVDDVKVMAQTSKFYGGWITPEIVGPFKGDSGTEQW